MHVLPCFVFCFTHFRLARRLLLFSIFLRLFSFPFFSLLYFFCSLRGRNSFPPLPPRSPPSVFCVSLTVGPPLSFFHLLPLLLFLLSCLFPYLLPLLLHVVLPPLVPPACKFMFEFNSISMFTSTTATLGVPTHVFDQNHVTFKIVILFETHVRSKSRPIKITLVQNHVHVPRPLQNHAQNHVFSQSRSLKTTPMTIRSVEKHANNDARGKTLVHDHARQKMISFVITFVQNHAHALSQAVLSIRWLGSPPC